MWLIKIVYDKKPKDLNTVMIISPANVVINSWLELNDLFVWFYGISTLVGLFYAKVSL